MKTSLFALTLLLASISSFAEDFSKLLGTSDYTVLIHNKMSTGNGSANDTVQGKKRARQLMGLICLSRSTTGFCQSTKSFGINQYSKAPSELSDFREARVTTYSPETYQKGAEALKSLLKNSVDVQTLSQCWSDYTTAVGLSAVLGGPLVIPVAIIYGVAFPEVFVGNVISNEIRKLKAKRVFSRIDDFIQSGVKHETPIRMNHDFDSMQLNLP